MHRENPSSLCPEPCSAHSLFLFKGKMGAHDIAVPGVGAHLLPLALGACGGEVNNLTQGQCDVWVTTVVPSPGFSRRPFTDHL